MPKIRNTSPLAVSLVMKDGRVETIKPNTGGEAQSVTAYDADHEHNKQMFAAGVLVLDGDAAPAPRKAPAKRARKR